MESFYEATKAYQVIVVSSVIFSLHSNLADEPSKLIWTGFSKEGAGGLASGSATSIKLKYNTEKTGDINTLKEMAADLEQRERLYT